MPKHFYFGEHISCRNPILIFFYLAYGGEFLLTKKICLRMKDISVGLRVALNNVMFTFF